MTMTKAAPRRDKQQRTPSVRQSSFVNPHALEIPLGTPVIIENKNGNLVWRQPQASKETAIAEREKMRTAKDFAYYERNQLLAFITRFLPRWILPAWLEDHPATDEAWEMDWRNIVYVQLPTGQACWHIHNNELADFSHLEYRPGNSWDGHTTTEKYERLRSVAPLKKVTLLSKLLRRK